MSLDTRDAPAGEDLRRRLLLEIGADLLSGGLPVHDIEETLRRMGAALGADEVAVAATPTGLFVTLGPEAAVGFRPVGPPLRFEQTTDLLHVAHAIQTGTADCPCALAAIKQIRDTPSRWPAWISDLGAVPIGAGLCLLLQPAPADVLAAAAASSLVALLTAMARRWPALRPLIPVVAAFTVSCLLLTADQAGLVSGPLRIIVAVLAVLLPGSLLVTGLAEIAAGAMQAGSARLVTGTAQLVMFLAGVLAAAAVTRAPAAALDDAAVRASHWWTIAGGLALTVAGIVLAVTMPARAVAPVAAVVAVTAAAQMSVQAAYGTALGGLAGAVVAAVAAAAAHRLPKGPAWQVAYLPAFWILVPGGFGLLTTAQIDSGAGIHALITAVSAVVGVSVGTLVGAPISRLAFRTGQAADRR